MVHWVAQVNAHAARDYHARKKEAEREDQESQPFWPWNSGDSYVVVHVISKCLKNCRARPNWRAATAGVGVCVTGSSWRKLSPWRRALWATRRPSGRMKM